jgi:hypothetical protein
VAPGYHQLQDSSSIDKGHQRAAFVIEGGRCLFCLNDNKPTASLRAQRSNLIKAAFVGQSYTLTGERLSLEEIAKLPTISFISAFIPFQGNACIEGSAMME